MFSAEDVRILRELAGRVHSIAQKPREERKRELWRRHTSLQGKRPLIFVSPEGSWDEILPKSGLLCEGPFAREVESELRRRLFRADVIRDDVPVEDVYEITVGCIPYDPGWGIPFKTIPSTAARGSWHHDPVIKTPSDWKKLVKPHLQIDAEGAQKRAEELREAVGELLRVQVTGIKEVSFHIAHIYCDYRGLDNFLYDLVDEPDMVEDVFSFFEEGLEGLLKEAEEQHLLELNSDYTYHYTGGLGYTYDLPAEKSGDVTYSDMWGAAEAQEYAVVSPKMFEETIMPHERRLLARFGLTGYGCCDDLTEKLDSVLQIKNLRRVAACPWANLEKMADRLRKKYILTWKPNPAYLAQDRFNESGMEQYMTDSLRQAKAGYPEIILRDTHSCRNDPARFGQFVRITRRAIDTVYGQDEE